MAFDSKTIALIGATGNLGKVVHSKLEVNGYRVLSIGRPNKVNVEGSINPFEGIEIDGGVNPDLIINLSNFYTPHPSGPDFGAMKNSIVGVAQAIVNFNSGLARPIISASTYFQYAPKPLSPWSEYSKLKSEAQSIFISNSKSNENSFTDFVLFDTYGGDRKDKFLDIALNSLNSSEPISATLGDQLINLSHVNDLASAVVTEAELLLQAKNSGSRIYQLKSENTYTLQKLAELISDVTEKVPNIAWGALPYREKEVFEIWDTRLEMPPYWNPHESLEEYIKQSFRSSTAGRDAHE